MSKPRVLFVCVHNAGRSQMAAAFLTHMTAGAVKVRSAGSEPTNRVNPAAVQTMAEVGIDISSHQLQASAEVVTVVSLSADCSMASPSCWSCAPLASG